MERHHLGIALERLGEGAPLSHKMRSGILVLLAIGLFVMMTALVALDGGVVSRLTVLVAGLSFLMVALLLRGLALVGKWRAQADERALTALYHLDPSPCFTTNIFGGVLYRNPAAVARFGQDHVALADGLRPFFAAPSAVLRRLQARAAREGFARDDLRTKAGLVRLGAHRVANDRYFWRLEIVDLPRTAPESGQGVHLPMLVANGKGAVLFANEAALELIGTRPRKLDQLFISAVPRHGETAQIVTPDGPASVLFVDIPAPDDRHEIVLLPMPAQPRDGSFADLEDLPVALIVFSGEGQVEVANRRARELLLPDTDEVQDFPAFHGLYEGLGRPVQDWLADVLDGRSRGGSEVLRPRAGAPDTFHQVTLSRMTWQGRPAVLAVAQDATAMKLLEAQFVQSQKMQAIGQLAGGVAHDFNNLLTAITGHCDILLLRHKADDPAYGDLVQIHQNANRAAALVGQLLAFSRKQTLNPEQIDLPDVLGDLVHLLNRLVGEKVSLRLSHAADLGPIRADRRQLEQVIVNLIVNARDAMPSGGTVRIASFMQKLQDDLHRDRAVVPAGDYAVIRVTDSGVGIPPERLSLIFEPFYTTKRAGEGTGLGLSTAYGIVKQSGGFIFVDSVVNEGTVFHLYFPIHKGPAENAAPPAPARPKSRVQRQGEGVILLAEDEAPVRAFASRALRLRGYTVIESDSGDAALRHLADPDLRVDLFVTDVVMPGRDGPSWVREAHLSRPDIPVVFMSGYAEDSLSEDQARVPNSVFLAKPFSLQDLSDVVQAQIEQSRAERAGTEVQAP